MKAEFIFQKVSVVEFRAFDKFESRHFYDTEPDQISEYIFKNICPTAVIIQITDYPITNIIQRSGFRRKL